MRFLSFLRMPESSGFSALDTGLRRYDELIRASLNYIAGAGKPAPA
jgi:hypothetical protein